MEDLKWIFYILLAVIILVVRMWLKAFQSSKTSSNRPEVPKAYPTPAPPATSYQDILKEMQASSERAKQTISPTKSLENTRSAEKTIVEPKTLERTESRAKSLETIVIKPREVIRKPSSIELARQVKPQVATPPLTAVNYGKLLQNPQNIRTAFILSEILNRRVDY